MMSFLRQLADSGVDSTLLLRDVRWWVRLWGRWVVFAMVCASGGAVAAGGQAPMSGAAPNFGVFLEGGLQNTQYPSYADNSLGANVGLFVQPDLLVGLEVRGDTFPVKAKYKQGQVTAGWRVGLRGIRHVWLPYAYGGGGISRAQDVNGKGSVETAWDPCWQTSLGLDRSLGDWSVRLFEVTYRETYTSFRTLRSGEVTVGVVRRF